MFGRLKEAVDAGEYSVLQAGRRGLVVTLPSTWARKNGLYPGSKIRLQMVPADPRLLIVKVVPGK